MYNTQAIHLDLFENELNAFFPIRSQSAYLLFYRKSKGKDKLFLKKNT